MKKDNESPLIVVSAPSRSGHPARNLTQEDVWGEWTHSSERISFGMIVAQGYGDMSDREKKQWEGSLSPDICPIWKDKLPYKSITVICDKSQQSEVEYWLEYVHGGGSISKTKSLPNNKIAIRSNYMCW